MKLLMESGLQNIKELAKQYNKCVIYGHIDCDGVTSSIAIKEYLKRYGIVTIDWVPIQYGAKEYAITAPSDDVMGVLVDFAHGKCFMKIHTDHHLGQIEYANSSKNFRHSPSNAETLSAIISPNDIFPTEDIELISMIDSAGFAKKNIQPIELLRSTIKLEKTATLEQKRKNMAVVVDRMLLAYKNKPGFLRQVVLDSKPSLISMYTVIVKYIAEKVLAGEKGWATPEDMEKNAFEYNQRQQKNKVEGNFDKIDELEKGKSMLIKNVAIQVDGGYMSKPGMYNRYTPHMVNSDAKFIIMVWTYAMLIQASANPWQPSARDVDVAGIIMNDVFEKYKAELSNSYHNVSFLAIKKVYEQETIDESIGFNFEELNNLFKAQVDTLPDEKKAKVEKYMNMSYSDIVKSENMSIGAKKGIIQSLLNCTIPLYEVMKTSSGGHKAIINLIGLEFWREQLMMVNHLKENGLIYNDYAYKYYPRTTENCNKKANDLMFRIIKDITKALNNVELNEKVD